MKKLKRLFALIIVFIFGTAQVTSAMSNSFEKSKSDKVDNAISVKPIGNNLTDGLSQHLC